MWTFSNPRDLKLKISSKHVVWSNDWFHSKRLLFFSCVCVKLYNFKRKKIKKKMVIHSGWPMNIEYRMSYYDNSIQLRHIFAKCDLSEALQSNHTFYEWNNKLKIKLNVDKMFHINSWPINFTAMHVSSWLLIHSLDNHILLQFLTVEQILW